MSGDNKEIRFQGAGVSPGLARGVIHVVRDDFDDVPRYHIEPSQIGNEIARFEAALVQTRVQILEMQQKIAEAIGAKDAAIFDARSEERRVGKECRSRWWACHEGKKQERKDDPGRELG